ncbi:MAG: hypothetical protein QM713_07375 [Arachnia sp.]
MKTVLTRALTLCVAALVAGTGAACSPAQSARSQAPTPPTSSAAVTPSPSPSPLPSPSPSASASETTPEVSPTATDPGDEAVEALPVEAMNAGFAFTVPEDWQSFDFNLIAEMPTDEWPDALNEMAENMGMTPKDFIAVMQEQMEVMVVGEIDPAFTESINVVATPIALLPPDKELTALADQLGWEDATIERPKANEGEVAVIHYTMDMDEFILHGRSIMVKVTDGHKGGIITVSTSSEKQAKALEEQILDTLTILPT